MRSQNPEGERCRGWGWGGRDLGGLQAPSLEIKGSRTRPRIWVRGLGEEFGRKASAVFDLDFYPETLSDSNRFCFEGSLGTFL